MSASASPSPGSSSSSSKEPDEEVPGPSRPPQKEPPNPRLDPVTLSMKAKELVQAGKLGEAHDLLHLYLTTLPSFEEDLKRVREEGKSERVMVRANYSIVKEALWSTGFAELLFRDALLEGRELLRAAGDMSDENTMKFDESLMQVLADLGLSWTGRKGFGKLACQALLHVLKFEPKNIYMWTHLAEACVSYLSTHEMGDDFLFAPLNDRFDWLARPIKDEMNSYARKIQIWKYCPTSMDLLKIPIDWKLASRALLIAKRLMFTNGRVQGDRLLHSQILLLSAYVCMRKKMYFASLRHAREAVRLEDIPTEHRILAKFYVNIATVLSNKAGLDILRPLKISDDDRITCRNPENLDKLVEILNRKQSYAWVLLLIKSGDITGAQILIKELLEERTEIGCRALVTLLEFMNWVQDVKKEEPKKKQAEPEQKETKAEPAQKEAEPGQKETIPSDEHQPEQAASSNQPETARTRRELEHTKRRQDQEQTKAKMFKLHEVLKSRSNIYKNTVSGYYKNIEELISDDKRNIDLKAVHKFKHTIGVEKPRPRTLAAHGIMMMKVIDKTTKKSIRIPF